jgi:hypothetical protein
MKIRDVIFIRCRGETYRLIKAFRYFVVLRGDEDFDFNGGEIWK